MLFKLCLQFWIKPKVEIDKEEFEKYILSSFVPL